MVWIILNNCDFQYFASFIMYIREPCDTDGDYTFAFGPHPLKILAVPHLKKYFFGWHSCQQQLNVFIALLILWEANEETSCLMSLEVVKGLVEMQTFGAGWTVIFSLSTLEMLKIRGPGGLVTWSPCNGVTWWGSHPPPYHPRDASATGDVPLKSLLC